MLFICSENGDWNLSLTCIFVLKYNITALYYGTTAITAHYCALLPLLLILRSVLGMHALKFLPIFTNFRLAYSFSCALLEILIGIFGRECQVQMQWQKDLSLVNDLSFPLNCFFMGRIRRFEAGLNVMANMKQSFHWRSASMGDEMSFFLSCPWPRPIVNWFITLISAYIHT